MWVAGGLATLGVIGLSFRELWKNKNPESAAKGAAGAINQFVTPHKDPNFTGIEPKRSYAEVEALCKQVMIADNGGLACQTMSFFNSLRLYKAFGEQEGTFASDANQQRINTVLSSASSPTELKEKAFDFCRRLLPQEYTDYLANNTISMGHPKKHLTPFIPHFLSEYVFNKTEQSVSTFNHVDSPVNTIDIASTLEALCHGKVGMFYQQGHVISLVGIQEAEQGVIQQVVDHLKQGNIPASTDLLEKVNLLIYDQLKSNASVEGISLKKILEANTSSNKFMLRIFNSDFKNNRNQEIAFNNHSSFPYNIISGDFHQNLMNTGNAVFNTN